MAEPKKLSFCYGALDEIKEKLGYDPYSPKDEDKEFLTPMNIRKMAVIAIKWGSGNKLSDAEAEEALKFVDQGEVLTAYQKSVMPQNG